jgi:hypothetical protein
MHSEAYAYPPTWPRNQPADGTMHETITRNATAILYLDYGISSPNRAQQACIDRIAKEGGWVDLKADINAKAANHFDAEEFIPGAAVLLTARIQAAQYMDNLEDDTARERVGRVLHVLQDFYAHTSWTELHPSDAEDCRLLSISMPKAVALGLSPLIQGGEQAAKLLNAAAQWSGIIASPTEKTCQPCELLGDVAIVPVPLPPTFVPVDTPVPMPNCYKNIVTPKLTSGYWPGEDVAIPDESLGKCLHGGFWISPTPGYNPSGINKDGNQRVLAPHAKLHNRSVVQATLSTYNYIKNFRGNEMTELEWASFLMLGTGPVLGAMIDTTQSMKPIISTVAAGIRQRAEAEDTAGGYLLVPFNDPVSNSDPITVTESLSEYADALDALTASGGGDCPEPCSWPGRAT